MNTNVKILITNDDGIFAPGIKALVEAIKPLGDVTVVAPDMEKSAVGHAITISDPLRVMEVERDSEFFGYAVNGTPADCVKLAVKAILQETPDMVISGINLGPNTGINAIYSGTVSAATEGTFMGIPSFAVSLTSFEQTDFSYAKKVAAMIAEKVLQNGLSRGSTLNVNIPALPEEQIKGILVTRQGKGKFDEFFDKRVDPFKRTYYWLSGKKMLLDTDEDVDDVAVNNKYVAVTPLHYDLTDYKSLGKLKNWGLE